MGFNKTYLTKEKILDNISKIDLYMKSESLIMDTWSSNFISDIRPKQRILREDLIKETSLMSSPPDTHKNFYLISSLSEALINLMTNPNWVDIHIVWIKTGFDIQEDQRGKFDILVKKAIESAISFYDTKK